MSDSMLLSELHRQLKNANARLRRANKKHDYEESYLERHRLIGVIMRLEDEVLDLKDQISYYKEVDRRQLSC